MDKILGQSVSLISDMSKKLNEEAWAVVLPKLRSSPPKKCSEDVRECNASEPCKRSTYYNGTKAWKVAGKHVTEAKRRGLSCGVTETTLKKKTCTEDVRVCPGTCLCT